MALAGMVALDNNALICDFAETYNIYDYRALPPSYVAVLAVGLRDNSRIKTKLMGAQTPLDIILQASIIDRLSTLIWMQTEDGHKGRNKPDSLVEQFSRDRTQTDKIKAFVTPEDFEKAREKILNS